MVFCDQVAKTASLVCPQTRADCQLAREARPTQWAAHP